MFDHFRTVSTSIVTPWPFLSQLPSYIHSCAYHYKTIININFFIHTRIDMHRTPMKIWLRICVNHSINQSSLDCSWNFGEIVKIYCRPPLCGFSKIQAQFLAFMYTHKCYNRKSNYMRSGFTYTHILSGNFLAHKWSRWALWKVKCVCCEETLKYKFSCSRFFTFALVQTFKKSFPRIFIQSFSLKAFFFSIKSSSSTI